MTEVGAASRLASGLLTTRSGLTPSSGRRRIGPRTVLSGSPARLGCPLGIGGRAPGVRGRTPCCRSGQPRALAIPGHVDAGDDPPVEPGGQPPGFFVQESRARGRHRRAQEDLNRGVVVLDPAPHDPPVEPCGRSGVARCIEQVRHILRVDVEASAPSSPSSSDPARAAAPPTSLRPTPVPDRRAAPIQWHRSPGRTGTAASSPRALRTAALVPPSHQTMSVSVPGPNVHSQRRISSRYPSASSSLPSGLSSGPSNQSSIRVQTGRLTHHPPSFRPRTRSPRAPIHARIRGATGRSPPQRVPGARVTVVSMSGTAARSCRALNGPADNAASTAARAFASQASPSVVRPEATRSLLILRRSNSAVRAPALLHAAGSRSRGKTKRVRRMASCLTNVRSS